ncbi:helix-turn-helix domain-containing protein [Gemella sp. zg-570]|uniref:helix-turn-helix transcriptional regulator n=1 Tax=Gemella sp. zg-570 TaxID=2840371 RepID=UPI001C0C4B12|nr:helix-turn-helix transcriptional regulator [Gemella sp. zg-570]QWQ38331.1 helix-turn-helix domain-containing protein [Gemella sp. zg-570]QWQ39262.1 helix-turn-helix domain-containing protein [Gemella sp. zg-570]
MVTLKELRESKGLSVQQAAKLLGISRNSLYNHEKNTRSVRLYRLKKISQVYGVSIDEIEFEGGL